ncbi:CLUMA_CG010075, isoform A [Clunio marinus]|uniref:CLUMA_CG010075, isoform A n=1 Tax=Clunio marinus TaxID=568069 RepID=A0A1J1IAD3_9DIPT|nr:CLUMA_CG010075, isoform A [Clunio marinus]
MKAFRSFFLVFLVVMGLQKQRPRKIKERMSGMSTEKFFQDKKAKRVVGVMINDFKHLHYSWLIAKLM